MSSIAIQSTMTPDVLKVLEGAGIIPKGTPPEQAAIFGKVCEEKGLSAFSKEIYLTGYKERDSGMMKYSVIVGINGFRKIAARTLQLAGIEDAVFDLQNDGTFKTAAQLKAANAKPLSATVTVYRALGGARFPFTHTAVFSEFSTGKQKWDTMPFQMIGKVAEAFAIRKGFSDETSGLSIEEEIGAMTGETIDVRRKSPEVQEAALPEQFHSDFEQACDILNTYTDINDVVEYWEQQPSDSPAMMFVTFAKAFFDAAARCSHTAEDLGLFWNATPKKWQQAERLKSILSERKKQLVNGAA